MFSRNELQQQLDTLTERHELLKDYTLELSKELNALYVHLGLVYDKNPRVVQRIKSTKQEVYD